MRLSEQRRWLPYPTTHRRHRRHLLGGDDNRLVHAPERRPAHGVALDHGRHHLAHDYANRLYYSLGRDGVGVLGCYRDGECSRRFRGSAVESRVACGAVYPHARCRYPKLNLKMGILRE